MEGLKLIPYLVLLLAISGVIVGAGVMTTSGFGDTVTKCFNASYTVNESVPGNYGCFNNSETGDLAAGSRGSNLSAEYFAIVQSMNAQLDVAEQLPTVAVIAVMVVIISIIAGVFVYMRYFA